MRANSIKGYSHGDIKDVLEQSMNDGFKPTLGTIVLSIKQDHTAICELLDEQGIAVFGSTTAGELIDPDIGKNR